MFIVALLIPVGLECLLNFHNLCNFWFFFQGKKRTFSHAFPSHLGESETFKSFGSKMVPKCAKGFESYILSIFDKNIL
jgi:hypothetical protein